MTKEALKQLISSMSQEEKINQLLQLSGAFFEEEAVITGPEGELDFGEENKKLAGSVLGAIGALETKKIQSEYMKNHPHQIPLLFMGDIINGYRTIFPIPLAQGCTFNPKIAERGASIAAKEASASGLHVTFSPMADLVRDARWGRVMESTGEDGHLNARFAEAMVRGYQGKDIKEPGRLAACVKHFAGYGAPMGGREYNHVELSERTLRDDYLGAYQAAIGAGCELVMTSFQTLNRIPSTGNKELMRGILREEMGFEGVLISDWGAVRELIVHGVAEDEEEAAVLSVEAGVDIDMVSDCYSKGLKKPLKEGTLDQNLLDEAVLRILKLKNKLGLFEHPFKDADETEEKNCHLCIEHREAAKTAAVESFVLLKNKENMLPLKKEEKSIGWIGPYIKELHIYGSWSMYGREKDTVSIEQALQKRGLFLEENYAKGSEILDDGISIQGFGYCYENTLTEEEQENHIKEALKIAKNCEMVVLAVGEHPMQTGEGASSGKISLAKRQQELIDQIYQVNQNIVLVLFCGRPLEIQDAVKKAKAVLTVWFPGTEGGNAITDVLFGDAYPSGRLSMCFPYSVGQMPLFYKEFQTGRPYYEENTQNRYVSRYLDIPNKPLYPFGYGLSYTTFSYSNVTLNRTTLKKGEQLTVSITVTNTGKREGKETIQLYLQDLKGSVARPLRELKGFEKVTLAPGQETCIKFTIEEEMLKFYNAKMEYKAEPGTFKVYVGPDCETKNCAEFKLI